MADKKRIKLLYVGIAYDDRDRAWRTYIPIVRDERPSQIERFEVQGNPLLSYFKVHLLKARPGAVISVEHEHEDGATAITPSTAKLIGYVSWAAELQSLSWAKEDERTRKRKLKKEVQRDRVEEALNPVREAYNQCKTRQQRTLLLGRVITYVTGARGL